MSRLSTPNLYPLLAARIRNFKGFSLPTVKVMGVKIFRGIVVGNVNGCV